MPQTNFLSAHGLQKVRSVIRKRSEAVDCPKLSGFGTGGFHRIFLIPLTIRNERSAFRENILLKRPFGRYIIRLDSGCVFMIYLYIVVGPDNLSYI